MTTQILDERVKVNELISLYPQTIPVFNEFGIDSCCGGGVAIEVAAARDGADLSALVAKLKSVIGE